MTQADWRALFDAALAERGPAALARALGYNNHTLVSRIAKGHVEASPAFQQRLIALLAKIDCPHLSSRLAPEACRAYAARSYGAITAADVPHWRACQRCQHKPGGAQ